ncbi:MAG TPA: murein transglycosylase A [Sphingomonadaceae bacterium]|nr:murein transglycosylase A [Sphingomonadaceae bacterium]
MGGLARGWAILAATTLLAACGRVIPISEPLPVPANALLAGIAAGPSIGALDLKQDDAGPALASFVESCPRLLLREDTSGLTAPDDWRAACVAATSWRYTDAPRFFAEYFETVRVARGEAFATGYFEPEIEGVRERQPGFDVPVYGMPHDLVRAWPDDMPEAERTGRPPLGRYDGERGFVPYYTRAEIEDGALAGRGLEIGWVKDSIEFFFLQIQGSGRLRAPDGSVIRIGYAGQNGHGYTAIGRPLRERGQIGDGTPYPTSMQGIMGWLRDHPGEAQAVMNENASWVFFRELTGDGPLGALEVPVRALSSVATDPAYVPLGAPVFLAMDRSEADGLWIAQDTGGAIKGVNRFDTFWGAGAEARAIAGGMSARGQALLLLPKGTLKRLGRD